MSNLVSNIIHNIAQLPSIHGAIPRLIENKAARVAMVTASILASLNLFTFALRKISRLLTKIDVTNISSEDKIEEKSTRRIMLLSHKQKLQEIGKIALLCLSTIILVQLTGLTFPFLAKKI